MDAHSEVTSPNVHFTYTIQPDCNNLCQGDILQITPELKAVLEKVHPYFLSDQYKYFIVLTQSCDLVRRIGKDCKAAYISLAAVRDFNSFFEKEIVTHKKLAKKVNGIILMDSAVKSKAIQFIERIYNNTEPDYFFLYKDESLQFPSSMIAFLRVSFALKSAENYDICLNAKLLELSDEFKAKLGWLVGNIYSRVGTTDWDSVLGKEEKEQKFRDEIESRCIISGKNQLKQLEKELERNNISDLESAQSFINGIKIETNHDKVIAIIDTILNGREKADKLDKKEHEIILSLIKSNTMLKTLIRKSIAE